MEEEQIPEVREEDIFDNDIIEDTNNFQGIITFVAVLLAAGGFIALSWYAYENYSSADSSGEIPVILADRQPTRIKPTDPGGMNIPNVDKKVYDNLSEFREKKLPKVERILPRTEEPVDIKLVVEQASKKELEDKIAALEDFDNDADYNLHAQKVAAEAKAKRQISKRTKKLVISAVAKRKAMEKKKMPRVELVSATNPTHELVKSAPKNDKRKITKSDFKPKGKKDGYRVQIASLKSTKAANKEWDFLRRKHKALLGGVKYFVVPKVIKGKGRMYRLQLGPFSSESFARNLCNKLSESGQGCFILRPGR
jgi:cell division septation protein DedD